MALALAPERPRWLPAVAVPALVFLVWGAWTVAAWLADGPGFDVPNDAHPRDWWAARAFEAGIVAVSVAVAVAVARGCRREGRLLTFDFLVCAAAASAFWATHSPNFFEPMLRFSSNWAHVDAMCGSTPFVVNESCARSPDPLFFWLMWAFGLPGFAIAGQTALTGLRRRRPGLSRRQEAAVVIAAGCAIDLAIELPAVALGLWTWRPGPVTLSLGGGLRYPMIEMIAGGLFLALPILLRDWRDRTGWSQPPAVTFLALVVVFQAIAWVVLGVPLWLFSLVADQWPALPGSLAV